MRQHPAAKHGRRRWRRSVVALVSVAVTALLVAASALAYFTTVGAGAAPSAAADGQAVTLTAGTPSAQLYPGGSADVAVDVSNPNRFSAHIGSLSLDAGSGTGGFEVDAAHTGCDPSVLSFTTQTNGGGGWSVPPKVGATNGLLAVDLPNALAMDAGAADACQGASFLVHLSVGS
jgi:hypothetical protein